MLSVGAKIIRRSSRHWQMVVRRTPRAHVRQGTTLVKLIWFQFLRSESRCAFLLLNFDAESVLLGVKIRWWRKLRELCRNFVDWIRLFTILVRKNTFIRYAYDMPWFNWKYMKFASSMLLIVKIVKYTEFSHQSADCKFKLKLPST